MQFWVQEMAVGSKLLDTIRHLSRYCLWIHSSLAVPSGLMVIGYHFLAVEVWYHHNLDRRWVRGPAGHAISLTGPKNWRRMLCLSSSSWRKVALGAGAWLGLLWFPLVLGRIATVVLSARSHLTFSLVSHSCTFVYVMTGRCWPHRGVSVLFLGGQNRCREQLVLGPP